MRVIIVGGGIGGLAAALALARGGAEVQVLERAAAFGEVGVGLQLAPNATRVLDAWGLEPSLTAVAFVPEAVEIRDAGDGRLLLRTPLGAAAQARWGAPYLQLHRADLHAVLAEAALSTGAELTNAAEVTEMNATPTAVTVRADARWIGGDVLIVADGLQSQMRQRLERPTHVRFTGEVAWRGLVRSDQLPPGLIAPTATVWTAPGRHLVHYFVRGGEWVSFAGFTSEGRWRGPSWSEPAAPGALAAAFAGWPAPVAALVAAAEAAEDGVGRWAILDRPQPERWAMGRTALLGDAAHPMSPFLAQGAGMAIEDAESLARHLLSGDEPATALKAYEDERRRRVGRVRAWAARNGRVFHLPTPLRRAAFGIARLGPWSDLDWLYGYRPPRSKN